MLVDTIFKECRDLSDEEKLAIVQVEKIGQAESVFSGFVDGSIFRELLAKLVAIDRFYREIGGIIGYQTKILELLRGDIDEKFSGAQFHSPAFIDISNPNDEVKEAIQWGIDAMPEMAEIYPLGGAADRLHLLEEKTGIELPAAKLVFAGKTLLERLIQDLEARELLYYKKYGVRLTTPIAIMTSHEKNNHAHVMQICEDFKYFGRPKGLFRFFSQPLVPAVTREGSWCMAAPLKPVFKPGGHGAIWKLARDEGIFDWLQSLNRSKCLVRQINNPIAGLDYGLLAFTGIGWKKKMVFGFASAPRLLKAAEGVNVVVEKGSQIVLTNIEYCDFHKFGIEDTPLVEHEPYSRFSSNTNILFADLNAISNAVKECPFPGLLVNAKKGSFVSLNGEKREEIIARLESTMQNIADVFVEEKKESFITERTFVTYNVRHKTISTAKRAFVSGGSYQETPESCFYDLMLANRELLVSCNVKLPEKRGVDEYLKYGPEFLFLYHPALGPLYSIIQEKIKGGSFELGSCCILELGEFYASNLQINGKLEVVGSGSCILENVKISNRGVDWSLSSPFWKMNLKTEESVKIILKGQSQFIARNIEFKGNQTFVVEDGEIREV